MIRALKFAVVGAALSLIGGAFGVAMGALAWAVVEALR